MRYPAFLPEGGAIGCPAPSFGCSIEPYNSAFRHAMEVLKAHGHTVIPGPNAFASDGIGISSTPENCGKELTQMYCDPKTQALISCGGGELMCEVLDHVDFDAVRAAVPKWYMGYSDNTNFTFLLATLCDTASIYGPCAPAFGMEPWHPAIQDAYDVLRGTRLSLQGYAAYETESKKDETHPLEPYNPAVPSVKSAWLPETRQVPGDGMDGRMIRDTGGHDTSAVFVSGRLLGGCLDCLVNLCGTNFDQVTAFAGRYAKDGILWFLEACDLNVFGIRRALWELDHAGWFRGASGFLIGRPLCMGQEMMGLDQYRAVTEILGKYKVPILMDLDIGHLPPMMPMITGALGEVTLENGQVSLQMLLK